MILAGSGSDPTLWKARRQALAAQPVLLVTLVAPPEGPPLFERVPPRPSECFVPLAPHSPALDAAIAVEHLLGMLSCSRIGVDFADVRVVCRETVGEFLWFESRPQHWASTALANFSFAGRMFAEADGALLHVASLGPFDRTSDAASLDEVTRLANAFQDACPEDANLIFSFAPGLSEQPRVRTSIFVVSRIDAGRL